MSLLATSYRYENEGSAAKSFQKAFKRQQIRIKGDEKYASGEKNSAKECIVAEIIKRPEKLEEVTDRRKAKGDNELIKEELKYEHKVSILLRRSQLQRLLTEEYKSYERDLSKQGKTFYLERI